MTYKTIILIFTLVTTNVFALDVLYEFSGKKYELVEIKHRLVSASCAKSDCIAKSVEVKAAPVANGEDPAVSACLLTMKGAYIQLHDGNQNEESVCVFEDKSFMTFGSIRAELFLK